MKGGKIREEASEATGSPLIASQPSGQGNPRLERSAQVASSRNPDSKGMRDQEMPNLPESAAYPMTKPHKEKEQCLIDTLSPNNKPSFSFPTQESSQRATREATSNPFATPGKKGKEARDQACPQVNRWKAGSFRERRGTPQFKHRQDRNHLSPPFTHHKGTSPQAEK
ncbi:unnamed protein product [Sphagnum tenellum]